MVNERSETEFKHSLRERRKEFNEFIELIEKGDIDELKKKLQAEVDVITETLGDWSDFSYNECLKDFTYSSENCRLL